METKNGPGINPKSSCLAAARPCRRAVGDTVELRSARVLSLGGVPSFRASPVRTLEKDNQAHRPLNYRTLVAADRELDALRTRQERAVPLIRRSALINTDRSREATQILRQLKARLWSSRRPTTPPPSVWCPSACGCGTPRPPWGCSANTSSSPLSLRLVAVVMVMAGTRCQPMAVGQVQ